jgi:hypothetical protein
MPHIIIMPIIIFPIFLLGGRVGGGGDGTAVQQPAFRAPALTLEQSSVGKAAIVPMASSVSHENLAVDGVYPATATSALLYHVGAFDALRIVSPNRKKV